MNYAVKILTPADADTVEAALWYDAQRLTDSPEIHRIRFADVRRAPVKRFKFYGLYYLIRDDEVWVIAVQHGRRHPRWLRERRRKLGE
jgi:plasmid stabilization system protein ParE